MPFQGVLRQRTYHLASIANSHRLILYSFLSVLALSSVILNALDRYNNFYSITIYLSRSNRSVLVLANFSFLVALLCGHVIQRIFFGTLRPMEVERLYDRLWFFVTESLLAFTIFRDEFDIPFALMFGFLLFVKSFHWLSGDRIEWMDQRPYPGPSLLFHLRMISLFVILWLADLVMFIIAVESTISHGVGGIVLFASEYGILMASLLNTMAKYLLSAYEFRRASRRGGENAPPWENKSMWIFYIELSTDFLKLSTYLVFFAIIITYYGLPLNIIRDVYITARSFIARLRALHRYQTATRNMDQRYPNATEAEMSAMSDRTCIICREEMAIPDSNEAPTQRDGPNTTPKKLPCGHIFHFHCLRSWLERQQSCPTCRRTVLDPSPRAREARTQAPENNPQRDDQQGQRGIQNQNQQRMNIPLGNPLGFMGRLFGPPAQAPIVPGVLQPPVAQNRNNPEAAQDHLPQEVFVQYHIQYQNPRNQYQQLHDQQPALQPVPPYAGFVGPAGVWQEWPDNRGQVHGVETNAATSANAPENGSNSFQSSSFTDRQRQSPSPLDVDPSMTNEDVVSTPENPREAAAAAALRRLGRLNDVSRSSGSSSEVPSQSSTASSSIDPAATQGRLDPTSSQPEISPSIPTLIPLYDYNLDGLRMPRTSPLTSVHESHTRSPSAATAPRGGQQINGALVGSPTPLTDEQLVILERLTREAIDERLRVLEGVNGTINRCIDDLLRMRSALPPAASPFVSQANHAGHAAQNNGAIPRPAGPSSRTTTSEMATPATSPPSEEVND